MKLALCLTCTLLVIFSLDGFCQQNQCASERTSVDLTIYNANFALIREERLMRFSQGINHIVLPDIPATIDGTSVHFSSLTNPSLVKVLEQNYQYDLVHQAKLLEKYIGKEIEFIRYNNETKKEYSVKGILLASGWEPQLQNNLFGNTIPYSYSGQLIAEINRKIEIGPEGQLILPRLPEGLILRPQLKWLVHSSNTGSHKTETSYIAHQLNWSCNYVALLNPADTKIDLTGWVTIVNNSGTSFNNAGLKLVAGDVNVIREELTRERREVGFAVEMDEEAAQPQFQQKELFEYKLYSLQRKTAIGNNETKQVELISAAGINAKKVFIYDGLSDQWESLCNNSSYRSQKSMGQEFNKKVGVFVTLKNEDKSGLGIALPKGKIRVYKRDNDGKEQFVGEDEIDHTPKDEEIKMYLGNAFDIVGERTQKDFCVIAPGHMYDETFEITVRNHKDEPVEVLVYEHPWRWNQWNIIKCSVGWEKASQTAIIIPVQLKKDEKKTITYTIRYTW